MPPLTSQANRGVLLRGVTAALVPSLVGTVVFERETAFRLKSLRSAPGLLTERITRSNGTGLLTFAYRLALTESDYDAELLMALSYSLFGLSVSYADFRVDGPGIIPPSALDSSPVFGYSFKFTYGLSVGRDSRFCFLSTNTREFAETGGQLRLVTGAKSIVLDVATPISVVANRSSIVPALASQTKDKPENPSSDEDVVQNVNSNAPADSDGQSDAS